MAVSHRILLSVLCLSFIAGCYEDRTYITLNPDGSGTIKQKFLISERLLVAFSAKDPQGNTPPATKQALLEVIDSVVDVTSITQTECPDGSRIIEFEGNFTNPEKFFLSDFCRDELNLRLTPAGTNKAAIHCNMSMASLANMQQGPSLEEVYGAAKGLYIERTIQLPAEITETNGNTAENKNTVSWVTDLRNKQALAKTKKFMEGSAKGSGSAVFSADALDFSLPLKIPASLKQTGKSKKNNGLKAEVSSVSINKKLSVDKKLKTAQLSGLEIGVKIIWSEENKPYGYMTPVLTDLTDDFNNDLVRSSTFSHQYEIHGRKKEKEVDVRAKAPANNAKRLKNIAGYVEVITDVNTEIVVLENINKLAGKEQTGNPVLDKLNCKIKDIHKDTMDIGIDGGFDTIQSVALLAENGQKLQSASRGSSGKNGCLCRFRKEISQFNKCEIEVITGHNIIKIPFSQQELTLP